MKEFLIWFNQASTTTYSSTLAFGALAHLYFVCIHPFEDGNGRIARALSAKIISKTSGEYHYLPISKIIEKNKKLYYEMIALNNKDLEVSK